MTITINAINVNDAYQQGIKTILQDGFVEGSRNGMVKVLPSPVVTSYTFPHQRVLFNIERNANPFFHFAEAIWMLAGRRDVGFLEKYNKQMAAYTDDGQLQGAYGHRWRNHFHIDQLGWVIHELQENPQSRRVVLAMWDPVEDMSSYSKDIPCNTHCYFRAIQKQLDITVCCRSNDMIWGAYGANAVHFSFMHELVARAAGLVQGRMFQLSNNMHVYERHWPLLSMDTQNDAPFYYPPVIPLLQADENYVDFLKDCEQVCQEEYDGLKTHFMDTVAVPMLTREDVDKMPHCDWKIAAQQWLNRKERKVAYEQQSE